MPVNAALTSPERAALANGTTTRKTYLSIVDNTPLVSGIVAGVTGYPTGDITMLSWSGTFSLIKTNSTLKITDSLGNLRGYYRTRQPPGPTDLFVGEIGRGDPGLTAQAIRLDVIQGGDLVYGMNRWDAWAVLPRILYDGTSPAQILEDWQQVVGTHNTYPDPIVQVTTSGKPGHRNLIVDAGHSYATVVLVATAIPWPTSGAITYLWTLPGAFTVVGGSIHTNTVTVRVPAAATNYTVQLDVTEANGGATQRFLHLWCWDFISFFPMEINEVQSDVRDRTSRKMTISLYDNGLSMIPDGTMVCVWDLSTWNGLSNSGFSFTDSFVGWVSQENRTSEAGLRSADIDIIGPGALLGMLNANSQYVTAVGGTPNSWQQVFAGISNIDWIIYWMIRYRSSLLSLFDYIPLGVSGAQGRMSAWDIPTGTLLQQCQTLAKRYGANFGTDSNGQIIVAYDPNLYPYASRSAIVKRDHVSVDDYMSIQVTRTVQNTVKRLRGEAFSWDGVSLLPTPYLCDSPDTVTMQGSSEETLQSQIVESQAVLNERNGNALYQMNNPIKQVVTRFDYNRDVYEPAQMQLIEQLIPARYSPTNVDEDRNTIPLSVSKEYIEGGSSTITLTAEGETAAEFATVTVPVPPPVALYGQQGVILPFSMIGPQAASAPASQVVIPDPDSSTISTKTTGNVQITGDPTHLFITQNYLSSGTTWQNIKPTDLGSFKIRHAVFDRFTVGTSTPGIYLLCSDGTNSAIWHTANAFRTPTPWSKGATLSKVYDLVRLTQSAGEIEVYCSGHSGTFTHHFDFRTGTHGWFTLDTTTPPDTYVPGLGFRAIGDGSGPTAIGAGELVIGLTNLCALNNGHLRIVGSAVPGESNGASAGGFVSGRPIPSDDSGGVINTGPQTWTGSFDVNVDFSATPFYGIEVQVFGGNGSVPGNTAILTDVYVTADGTDPFDTLICAPLTDAFTALSSDYGGSWSTEVDAGPSSGGTGFDVQHTGTVLLAGTDQKVRIATTLTGSYSDEAHGGVTGSQPELIMLPWSQWGATSLNNTGSAPQYMLGASALVSGEALWLVTGSGQHANTPSVSSTKGLPVGPNCASAWLGTKVTLLASISGVVHLFTGVVSGTTVTWTNRGAIPNGFYTRGRYLSNTGNQIFFASLSALYYSPDFGVSIYTRPSPLSSNILFLENWG